MPAAKLPGTDQPKRIIAPGYTFGTVTDQIATVVLTKRTPIFWMACFSVGIALVLLFLYAVGMLMMVASLDPMFFQP